MLAGSSWPVRRRNHGRFNSSILTGGSGLLRANALLEALSVVLRGLRWSALATFWPPE